MVAEPMQWIPHRRVNKPAWSEVVVLATGGSGSRAPYPASILELARRRRQVTTVVLGRSAKLQQLVARRIQQSEKSNAKM